MTTRYTMMKGLALLGVTMGLQACLFGGGPLFGDGPEQGYTECGDFLADPGEDILCQPGQYCDDPTFSECADGCLSNENCADDQRCVKADGTQIGSCQAEVKRPASEPRNGAGDVVEGSDAMSGLHGFTYCGEGAEQISCHPGQYCSSPRYGYCTKGCLSDLNCGDEQLCVKEDGHDEGSCQRAD